MHNFRKFQPHIRWMLLSNKKSFFPHLLDEKGIDKIELFIRDTDG